MDPVGFVVRAEQGADRIPDRDCRIVDLGNRRIKTRKTKIAVDAYMFMGVSSHRCHKRRPS